MEILSHRAALSSLLGLIALVTLVGCYKGEEVRTYNVAKEDKDEKYGSAKADGVAATAPDTPATPSDVASAPAGNGDATDRMLVAVVPSGEQNWFFKVVGPVAAIEKHEAEFNKFFESIRLESGQAKWETPVGWKEDGPSGMRAATIWVPAEGKPLEMTVMPSGGSLLDNVNRWRVQQMKLPPIEAAQLPETTREAKAGDQTITIIDLKGRYAGSGMMAPFAGGTAPGASGAPQLPAGHPPIDAGAPDGDK